MFVECIDYDPSCDQSFGFFTTDTICVTSPEYAGVQCRNFCEWCPCKKLTVWLNVGLLLNLYFVTQLFMEHGQNGLNAESDEVLDHRLEVDNVTILDMVVKGQQEKQGDVLYLQQVCYFAIFEF